MFSVVYNNIQKITNISIKKPIILISILNKYLDIPIYLDNHTPLHNMLPFHDEPVIRDNIIAKILFASCSAKISYHENFPVYGM